VGSHMLCVHSLDSLLMWGSPAHGVANINAADYLTVIVRRSLSWSVNELMRVFLEAH